MPVGTLDQFAKDTFEAETPVVTQQAMGARDDMFGLMDLAPEPEIRERQIWLFNRLAERFPEMLQPFIQQWTHGLQVLIHQFERRLRRPLSPAELITLSERFDRLGVNRLGDVVLDLSPDDLGTWLADPNAV